MCSWMGYIYDVCGTNKVITDWFWCSSIPFFISLQFEWSQSPSTNCIARMKMKLKVNIYAAWRNADNSRLCACCCEFLQISAFVFNHMKLCDCLHRRLLLHLQWHHCTFVQMVGRSLFSEKLNTNTKRNWRCVESVPWASYKILWPQHNSLICLVVGIETTRTQT